MAEERPLDKQQLDSMLAALLPFAHDQLAKRGAFFPFGVAMDRQTKTKMVAGHTGSDTPGSQDVIDLIVKVQRRDRSSYIATGICVDVRIRQADGAATDAIECRLEHESGLAVRVFEPYVK